VPNEKIIIPGGVLSQKVISGELFLGQFGSAEIISNYLSKKVPN